MAEDAPLIDRALFFGDPEITSPVLSPDGACIAFVRPFEKVRNLWVKRTEEPFSAAKRITNDLKRAVDFFRWSRDSKYVLFFQDQGGDENYNIYAIAVADVLSYGGIPEARNLTSAKGIAAAIYALPRTEPDIIYAGLNDRDKSWHDLYRIKISTGARELVRKNEDRVISWHFDTEDRLRLAKRIAADGKKEILRVDGDGLAPLYATSIFENCFVHRFHPDNRRVYLTTDKGERNFTELALLDAETGVEETVEADPENRTDIWSLLFSDRDDRLLATIYNREKISYDWKDAGWKGDDAWLRAQLPGLSLSFDSATADEQRWIVKAYGDDNPGDVYLFDRAARSLNLLFHLREDLPQAALSHQEPISYASSDGRVIPAYLTLPKGRAAKNLPLVVFPHGGPWSRDNWGFNGILQFLANRGYAVLQPNFRGSIGYGKDFLNAGNGEWGDRMQDDLTWGVKYLVDTGIADAKRVAIAGISYGGYATLAGVAFTPDVYAAAVAIVAPANLLTLLASFPPYWESIRTTFYFRMGDPRTPDGEAQLKRQSPLFSADKIRTPLMVVQGANDPRVTQNESDQIVEALHARGFPVEYLVAPDEGHGFSGETNKMAMFAAIEAFLARHLGGRCQAGVPGDVAQRLEELHVDPALVRGKTQ